MKVFPVIHLGETSIGKSVEQADTAFELGADGVYLIDHYNGAQDTRRIFETLTEVREHGPDRYVGLNILGLTVPEAFGRIAGAKLLQLPSDLWVDDVREGGELDKALEFRKSLSDLAAVSLHGGIAFKYTPTATNNANAASAETAVLKRYVDVITTSGLGTGKPPTVEKLAAMKFVSGGKPVAVASGIDLSNIESFGGIVDEVLVASSVETRPGSGVFEPSVLKDFIEIAHNLAD
jgi:hypothetical protein